MCSYTASSFSTCTNVDMVSIMIYVNQFVITLASSSLVMNNYGERYMAFFTPLVTGQYSMFITSDDDGELLMSDQPNITSTNITRSVISTSSTLYAILVTPFTILHNLF